MGGDGGTLNNTRREHARLREAKKKTPNLRCSVTECALTKEPLQAPIVVDRLGQLYNKEALIRLLLQRKKSADAKRALTHIKSLKRDTADVRELVCPVTRKVVTEGGGFTVGWECGCVVAPVRGVGLGEGCAACGKEGGRVRLGMTWGERKKVLGGVVEGRVRKGGR